MNSQKCYIFSCIIISVGFNFFLKLFIVKDLTGAIKHIQVKVREVNNLPSGLCIFVDFDEQDSAYGDAQGILAGFLGTLAYDCNLFPIDFERWTGKTGLPKDYFDEFATTIKV